MADISNPNNPVIKNENSETEQGEPTQHNPGPENRTEVIVKLVPCPNCNDGTTKKTKPAYKKVLKAIWAVVPIFIAIYAAIVSTGSQNAAWESAKAAGQSAGNSKRSADIAEQALTKVQRAFAHMKHIEAHPARDAQGNITSWVFQGEWENSGATNTKYSRFSPVF